MIFSPFTRPERWEYRSVESVEHARRVESAYKTLYRLEDIPVRMQVVGNFKSGEEWLVGDFFATAITDTAIRLLFRGVQYDAVPNPGFTLIFEPLE